MLRTLKELFSVLQPPPPMAGAQAVEHTLQLAPAVMLMEVMRADASFDSAERLAVNAHFDMQAKVRMVEYMWRVAYAYGHLSEHERHTLWRMSDLLHVPHGAYINTKMRAKQATCAA